MVVGPVIIVVSMKKHAKGCLYLDCSTIEMIWKHRLKYSYDVTTFLLRKNTMVMWNYFIQH